MPSPVGHALGGIVAGWRAVPDGARRADTLRTALVVGAFGVAPDLDLLFHDHRGPAHSLGAAILVGIAVSLLTRNLRWGLAAGLPWTSHVILDWLGDDNFAPIGVMALWPLSHQYFQSPLHLFPAVSRSYWLAEFWVRNAKALIVEVCLLGPLAAAVTMSARNRRADP